MRGPEHYLAAAQLLAEADRHLPLADISAMPWRSAMIAEAQVHATLALAAATSGQDDEAPPYWYAGPTWSSVLAYPPHREPPEPER